MLYCSVCTYPRTSYILKYRKILPESSERGWAEERLNRTDSTVSTRLVQSNLTGTTAEVKCRWGKICNNIRGLCIHQGRMACGSTTKQRQRSDFMPGETLEDPIQVTTHSTGNLAPTHMNLTWNHKPMSSSIKMILCLSYLEHKKS